MSKRNSHPGWAVQFSDGSWLGGAHGWFASDDAFYADIYDSAKEAEEALKMSEIKGMATIVPAWQPLCEHLRFENSELKKSNKISISDVDDVVFELENVLNSLKHITESDNEKED